MTTAGTTAATAVTGWRCTALWRRAVQNHAQLDELDGRWLPGQIRGRLLPAGWGASLGYPGLVLDPGGPVVDVQVFESADLPAHWSRLDEFEGLGYRRIVTTIRLAAGEADASVYVLRIPDDRS